MACFADISIRQKNISVETQNGPIQQYVLADIYSWLEAHFGLSRSSSTTTAFAIEVNYDLV
jgi:hypothetical protein